MISKPNEDLYQMTPEAFTKLKREYKKAVKKGKKSFVFGEHTLLVSYVHWLIVYLEPHFQRGKSE